MNWHESGTNYSSVGKQESRGAAMLNMEKDSNKGSWQRTSLAAAPRCLASSSLLTPPKSSEGWEMEHNFLMCPK